MDAAYELRRLNQGRVAWYERRPGDGGTGLIRDLSGFRNHLTVASSIAPLPILVQKRRALSFRATVSQKLERGTATGLPVATTAPFTTHFKHRTRAFVSLAQVFGFGAQLPGTTAGVLRYVLNFNSNYYFWGGGADWDTAVAWDVDNLWHDIFFTFDGNQTIRLYRDGLQRASRTAATGWSTANTFITMGSQHTSAASPPNCDLDDCGIWARELTAGEIAAYFRLTTVPDYRRAVIGKAGVAGGSTTFTYTPSGGITYAGDAPIVKSKVFGPTGGLTLSGAAPIIKGKTVVPVGGIQLSGAATMVKAKIMPQATGGIVFGGSANTSGTFPPSASNDVYIPTYRPRRR